MSRMFDDLRITDVWNTYVDNHSKECEKRFYCVYDIGIPVIKNVIFNPPATIVFWADSTKTVVKCMEGKEFNTWDGLAMAICKKMFGKQFKRTFRKWCGK